MHSYGTSTSDSHIWLNGTRTTFFIHLDCNFFYLVDKTTSRSNITYMRDYLIDCFSSPQHKHLLQFYKTDEIAMALNTLYDKRNKKNFTEVVFRGVPYADFDPSGTYLITLFYIMLNRMNFHSNFHLNYSTSHIRKG